MPEIASVGLKGDKGGAVNILLSKDVNRATFMNKLQVMSVLVYRPRKSCT